MQNLAGARTLDRSACALGGVVHVADVAVLQEAPVVPSERCVHSVGARAPRRCWLVDMKQNNSLRCGMIQKLTKKKQFHTKQDASSYRTFRLELSGGITNKDSRKLVLVCIFT